MIIGIGGVSNSGKSKLAKLIQGLYGEQSSIIICQDEFVLPEEKIPLIKDHINWEIPESIDLVSFNKAIELASSKYEIVIAEGLMVFYDEAVLSKVDKKLFITISQEEMFRRKQDDLRWGKVPDWYIEHIWAAYTLYGKINYDEKDLLIVDGEQTFPLNQILNFLKN